MRSNIRVEEITCIPEELGQQIMSPQNSTSSHRDDLTLLIPVSAAQDECVSCHHLCKSLLFIPLPSKKEDTSVTLSTFPLYGAQYSAQSTDALKRTQDCFRLELSNCSSNGVNTCTCRCFVWVFVGSSLYYAQNMLGPLFILT